MRRREFITFFGSLAAAAPFAAAAQSTRPRVVGLVLAFADGDPEGQRYAAAFHQELQRLGWTLGGNLRTEQRWGATNAERAGQYAAEMASLKPDLIVSHATIVTRAMVSHTKDIPIVFTNVSDPVGERFVESFARPGRNVTGFVNVEPTIGGKYLELLKDIAPSLTRTVMLFNPNSTPGRGTFFSEPYQAAGPLLSVQTRKGEAHSAEDIDTIIATAAREGGSGLIVIGEPFTNLHRMRILELAARHRLPAVCPYRFYAASGCLISYGVDFADQFRRAATYVDRVLKGEAPESLAVQSPVKFEMVINMKTAKSLGLTVPPRLLFTADEVIE